jgi:hypothetical protein
MKYISGLMLFVYLLFSCASNFSMRNYEISGNYSWHNPTKIELIFNTVFSNRVYFVDNLSLDKDSIFVFKTCGNIVKGNGKVSNDSLLLFVKQNRFRIDSLNYSKKYSKDTICPVKPMVFKILKNKLRINGFINGKEKYSILEKQK